LSQAYEPIITSWTGLTRVGSNVSVNAAQSGVTSLGTLTELTVSGALSVTNTTASTSTSTGALTIAGTGGLGVGGNVYAANMYIGVDAVATQTSVTSGLATKQNTISSGTPITMAALTATSGAFSGPLNVNGTISHTGYAQFSLSFPSSIDPAGTGQLYYINRRSGGGITPTPNDSITFSTIGMYMIHVSMYVTNTPVASGLATMTLTDWYNESSGGTDGYCGIVGNWVANSTMNFQIMFYAYAVNKRITLHFYNNTNANVKFSPSESRVNVFKVG